MNLKRRIATFVLAIILSMLFTTSAFAADTGKKLKITLSADQINFVEKYADMAIRSGAEHGMPWQTAMAQGIIESASGSSLAAKKSHNFHGIKSTVPGRTYKKFSSDEEGWNGYYVNLEISKAYIRANIREHTDDPKDFLKSVYEAGYSEDENYISKAYALIDGIEELRLENGWPTSSEVAAVFEENEEIDGFQPTRDYVIYTKNLEDRTAGPEITTVEVVTVEKNSVCDIVAGEARAEKSVSLSAGVAKFF